MLVGLATLAVGGFVVVWYDAVHGQEELDGNDLKQTMSIWAGVYDDDQAARGKDVYSKACTYCHRADLRGGSESGAPALVGHFFISRWRDKAVLDLFATIVQSMPLDGTQWGGDPPVKFSLEQYLDVVAYLLQANGFPPGDEELPTDARLSRILISERP